MHKGSWEEKSSPRVKYLLPVARKDWIPAALTFRMEVVARLGAILPDG